MIAFKSGPEEYPEWTQEEIDRLNAALAKYYPIGNSVPPANEELVELDKAKASSA